jgi:hypothetical protein
MLCDRECAVNGRTESQKQDINYELSPSHLQHSLQRNQANKMGKRQKGKAIPVNEGHQTLLFLFLLPLRLFNQILLSLLPLGESCDLVEGWLVGATGPTTKSGYPGL